MNGILPFVQMLEREETAVSIQETGDDRYFTAVHSLLGDDKDYVIEFFDGVPVTLSWQTENGRVRLNAAGDEF